MAYNTKVVKKDRDGNPIPQYYNKTLDEYEPATGEGGSTAMVLYNEDGTVNKDSISISPIVEKLERLSGTIIDESTRKADELARINKENERLSAETTRVGNETQRVITEEDRITAEAARKVVELERVNNEASRVQAENLRETRITSVEEEFIQHKEEYTNQRAVDNLKVATVEKGLNDYKSTMANVNVNQEAKQKATGYGIISLPKNTANGQVSVSVKGNTIFNYADDGVDYSKWTVGGIGSTKGVSGIHLVQDGANEFARFPTNLNPNTQYTLVLNIKAHNLTSVFVLNNTLVLGGISSPITTTLGLIKHTFTTGTIVNNRVDFAIGSTNADGTYIDFEILGIYEGNQTTNPLVNQKLSYGTKSTVSASRLKSVGKNLFKGELLQERDNGTYSLNNVTTEGYIGITPDTLYFAKYSLTYHAIYLIWYDINYSKISHQLTTDNSSFVTGISPTDAKYVRAMVFDSERVVDLGSMMVGVGGVEQTYEPYTESTQYLTNVGELRSLPNGVCDEVRVSEGKAIIRNKKYILQASDFIQYDTSRVNVDVVIVKKPTDSYMWNKYDISCAGSARLEGFPIELSGGITDDVNVINNVLFRVAFDKFVIHLSKGKYASLVDAQTNLAGLELTYQLAQEIVTPIQTSGNLISYPSGTVYVENIVADAGIYTTKFDIKELQLPIKSIDKLIKYNFETGVQTVLDTSLAVVSEDKKSFTHPNLTKDDMVFVDYYYDVEGTLGETTIEYLDSRHTIKDSVNNKFYKWDIKSTNGVPTVELTEVL